MRERTWHPDSKVYAVRRAGIGLLCLALIGCATASASRAPVPVILLVGGDDGLTLRLAEAIRREVQASSRYRLAPASQVAGIVVRIDENVTALRSGGTSHFRYSITFERGGVVVGNSAGGCPELHMRRCSRRVLIGLERSLGSIDPTTGPVTIQAIALTRPTG
jgi:hypothetical protein